MDKTSESRISVLGPEWLSYSSNTIGILIPIGWNDLGRSSQLQKHPWILSVVEATVNQIHTLEINAFVIATELGGFVICDHADDAQPNFEEPKQPQQDVFSMIREHNAFEKDFVMNLMILDWFE